MNQGKAFSRALMRMGIQLTWYTMGRPTCVTNPDSRLNIHINSVTQCRNSSFFLKDMHAVFCTNCNTSRVITTILQLFKSVQQDLFCIFISDVTNNSTHSKYPPDVGVNYRR